MAMNGAEERGTDGPIDSGKHREAIEGHAPQTMVTWSRSVTAFIVEHPELCLGIALALGVAIGVAVKRR